MRIRPYIPNKDYEYVSKWIDDERTHAFWCANLLLKEQTETLTEEKEKLLSENEKLEKQQKIS